MVYLTCAIIGLGGRGEIKHGLKQQHSSPLNAYPRDAYFRFGHWLRLRKVGTPVYVILFYLFRK